MNLVVLVDAVGTVIVAVAMFLMLNASYMRSIMLFIEEGNRLYIVASLRIVTGVLFLASANQCRIGFVIFILGLLFFASGVFVFAIKIEKAKAIVKSFREKPESFLRLAAAMALTIGAAIMFST